MCVIELLNCQYYLTSENAFSEHLEFINETPSNDTHFHFYSLTQNSIKFQLKSEEIVVDGSPNGGVDFFQTSYRHQYYNFGKNSLKNAKHIGVYNA